MIYVERNATDELGTTIRPNAAWFRDAEHATAIAMEEGSDHAADRAIYAHIEVKKALEHLFHDKCAYCESKMTATSDWDVEHFRPKGRVAEREDHPGYYWLAYTWENLYPSCQHCNQRRKDQPRWADPATLPAGGKADLFPVFDETTRAMKPNDDASAEHTLLIDPCIDDPKDYLGYDPTAQVFSLDDNPYGEMTIEVFHLNRRRLRDLRRETMQSVIAVLKLVKQVEQSGSAAVADLRAWLRNQTSDCCQHAGLARYVELRSTEFGV